MVEIAENIVKWDFERQIKAIAELKKCDSLLVPKYQKLYDMKLSSATKPQYWQYDVTEEGQTGIVYKRDVQDSFKHVFDFGSVDEVASCSCLNIKMEGMPCAALMYAILQEAKDPYDFCLGYTKTASAIKVMEVALDGFTDPAICMANFDIDAPRTSPHQHPMCVCPVGETGGVGGGYSD